MSLRPVSISVIISISFIAVFCLALIYGTQWGWVIIGMVTSIPCVWWHIKYARSARERQRVGPGRKAETR